MDGEVTKVVKAALKSTSGMQFQEEGALGRLWFWNPEIQSTFFPSSSVFFLLGKQKEK